MREKVRDDVRKARVLVSPRFAARKIQVLRVSSLGPVSTKKVKIVSDFSFELTVDDGKEDVNAASNVRNTPPCLCENTLPSLLREIVALRKGFR